jgi:integrase
MARVTTGYDAEGNQKRKTIYGGTRKEVNAALNEILKLTQAGLPLPKAMTVAAWLDTWLATYVLPSVRPTTYRSYEGIIRLHLKPTIGGVKLAKLQIAHVQQLVNDRPSRTGSLCRTVLRAALQQAMREGHVARNVAEFARPAKTPEIKRRVLSPEEMTAFLSAAGVERLKPLLVVLLGTGLRAGEILALRWSDVNLKENTLQVAQAVSRVKRPGAERTELVLQPPKTTSGRRTLPLSPDVAHALKSWRSVQAGEHLFYGPAYEESGYVFTHPEGQMLGYRALTDMINRTAKRAEIPHVNAHALRHTFATRMVESGAEARMVQELLGHSNVVLTLNIYTHPSPERKAKAVAAIDRFLNPVGVK